MVPPSAGCGRHLWTMWTATVRPPDDATRPVDDGRAGDRSAARLPGMVIEVVPTRLYAVARVLEAASARAGQIGAAGGGAGVGGPLGPAVAGLHETVAAAGGCLAGELAWLGSAVAAAADSWHQLDGELLAGRGAARPR